MKIIHVNRQHIDSNTKHGTSKPVYTVREGNKTTYAREVIIHGPSRLVYNGKQLKCGGRAWVETDSPVELIDPISYKEIT